MGPSSAQPVLAFEARWCTLPMSLETHFVSLITRPGELSSLGGGGLYFIFLIFGGGHFYSLSSEPAWGWTHAVGDHTVRLVNEWVGSEP